MKTRIEITLEVDRWVLVHQPRRTAWCSSCSRYVDTLDIDNTAIPLKHARDCSSFFEQPVNTVNTDNTD